MKILTVFNHSICRAGQEKIGYAHIPSVGDWVHGTEHEGEVVSREFRKGKISKIVVYTDYTGDTGEM